jgi:hypothetical protein
MSPQKPMISRTEEKKKDSSLTVMPGLDPGIQKLSRPSGLPGQARQ